MKTYAYLRVSTVLQDSENQRFEVLRFADERRTPIDEWVVETVSGTKAASERDLGKLLEKLSPLDTLIVTEISRLGRSLLDVMATLNLCMGKGVKVFTCKERFELADNISSKVMAFMFGLVAELERQLISSRTRESLARKKAMGVKLGRRKGQLSHSKLDGKEDQIKEFIEKKVSKASIAKILGVHPGTVDAFIKTRQLMPANNENGGEP